MANSHSLLSTASQPPPPLLLDRYEIGKLLGHGTFAKVYHTRNFLIKETVAIKVLDKDKILRSGLIPQIKREISILRDRLCNFDDIDTPQPPSEPGSESESEPERSSSSFRKKGLGQLPRPASLNGDTGCDRGQGGTQGVTPFRRTEGLATPIGRA